MKNSRLLLIFMVFLFLCIYNSKVAAEEDNIKSYIKSITPYVEKIENGTAKSVPVTSYEDVKNYQASTSLLIKISLSAEDVQRYKDKKLYLFKLKPYHTAEDLSTLNPVYNITVSENLYDYNISLVYYFIDLNSGEIYNKFMLCAEDAGQYTPVSDAHYIDDINCLADVNDAPRKASTKKGLSMQPDMYGEAKLLGVNHTSITMFVNDFISPEAGANTQTYNYGGEEFYFNIDKISDYDAKIRQFASQDINVTAIILLRQYQNTSGSTFLSDILTHRNADRTDGTVFFYGINTGNELGMKYFAALMSFIADRYVKGSAENGRIQNFVLGYQIGRSVKYNNCGSLSKEEYIDDYMRALRIMNTAVTSRFGGARVYVPFDNTFGVNPDENMNYVNKELIDLLCDYSLKEGNFTWNISFDAFNADETKPAFWKETTPTGDFSTPVITMKNIEILLNYLNIEKGSYLKDSQKRNAIITAGFTSGTSSGSKQDEELQAAAFIYAYKKAKYIPEIEAFIYHRQVDNSNDQQTYGLWNKKYESVNEPQNIKKIWEVFKYIETDKESEKIDFARTVIGITDWKELFPLYSPDEKPAVVLREEVPLTVKSTPTATNISRFREADISGFMGFLNINELKIHNYINESSDFNNTKMLSVEFSNMNAGNYGGIYKIFDISDETNIVDLKDQKYIGVKLRIDTKYSDITTVPFLLILEGKTAVVADASFKASDIMGVVKQTSTAGVYIVEDDSAQIFEGSAEVKPNEDIEIYFNIEKWAQDKVITKMSLMINPDSDEARAAAPADRTNADFNLYIYNIFSAIPKKGSFLRGLLIIVGIIAAVVILAYAALVIRAQLIRRKRRREKMMRRQRALRKSQNRQRNNANRNKKGEG